MSKKIDVRKRFMKIAYDQLNPDLSSLDGLEQTLVNWYCFQYNVPPNDDKLLSMTLEELLVLNQMHRIHDNPELAEEFDPKFKSYEDWLKAEMGDDYVSDEDMIAQMEAYEREEKEIEKEILETYPESITTNFPGTEGTED